MIRISNFKYQISNKYQFNKIKKLEIGNWKLEIPAMREGFTLVELLAVVTVLMATGTLIGSILFSTLRGTGKVATETAVRQNGNYAIAQMAKMIRNAEKFNGVSITGAAGTFSTNCTYPTPTPYKYLKIKSFDGGETTFVCDNNSSGVLTIASLSASTVTVTPTPAVLLDTSSVALKTSTCMFTCKQSTLSDPPVIGISFTLTQKGTTSLAENYASVDFNTSVLFRNFNR